MTERITAYVERLCRGGVDAFRIVGGEYASVQLGPDAFKRLCVKYDRVLVDAIHKHGAIAHYHNHGPVMRYLEDFAAIGMDSRRPARSASLGRLRGPRRGSAAARRPGLLPGQPRRHGGRR